MIKLKDYIQEMAPKSKEAESWIVANKQSFKDQYGEDWEEVLYATAWKLFGKKEERLIERGPGEFIKALVGKAVFTKQYDRAVDTLIAIVKRKQKENGMKHSLEYYALNVANQYQGINAKELAKLAAKKLNEDTAAPTNTTDGAANPDARPLFTKNKFAGIDCIEVDSDTYAKCKFGKKPYSRWSGIIEDENLRSFVQKNYQKTSKLMVMDSSSGAMVYIKR